MPSERKKMRPVDDRDIGGDDVNVAPPQRVGVSNAA
jgi:hypothetical protein